MKKTYLIATISILSGAILSSCGHTLTYRFNDRGDQYAYIYRNGDLSYGEHEPEITETTIPIDNALFKELLDKKEDFSFIHYSENCSYCERLNPVFSSYILSSYAYVYRYEESISDLINFLGSGTYAGNLIQTLRENNSTPTLFYVNATEGEINATALCDELLSHSGTSTILGDYLYPLYSTTNIYRFTEYDAFLNDYSRNEFTAIMDLSITEQSNLWSNPANSLRSVAITHEKALRIIDYSKLSDEEKSSITEDFSLTFDNGILVPYFCYQDNKLEGLNGVIDFANKYYES